MVVDDELQIVAALQDLLEEEGYRVIPACGGREALRLLSSEPLPDLVLTDLMMPDLDGHAFLAELRQDRRLADLPAVVTSAAFPAAVRLPEGCRFLAKPFDIVQMLDMIEELMKQRAVASSGALAMSA